MTPKQAVPTSFRLTQRALDALDEGATRFRMTRAQWLEFLAISAVSNDKVTIITDNGSIEIRAHEKGAVKCSK